MARHAVWADRLAMALLTDRVPPWATLAYSEFAELRHITPSHLGGMALPISSLGLLPNTGREANIVSAATCHVQRSGGLTTALRCGQCDAADPRWVTDPSRSVRSCLCRFGVGRQQMAAHTFQ